MSNLDDQIRAGVVAEARRRHLLGMTPAGQAALRAQDEKRPAVKKALDGGMSDSRRRQLLEGSELGRAVLRAERGGAA